MSIFRSSRVRQLEDRLLQLEGQLDLLRLEWKEWRRQLIKAAARVERAHLREDAPEPTNGEEPGSDPISAAIHARRNRGLLQR